MAELVFNEKFSNYQLPNIVVTPNSYVSPEKQREEYIDNITQYIENNPTWLFSKKQKNAVKARDYLRKEGLYDALATLAYGRLSKSERDQLWTKEYKDVLPVSLQKSIMNNSVREAMNEAGEKVAIAGGTTAAVFATISLGPGILKFLKNIGKSTKANRVQQFLRKFKSTKNTKVTNPSTSAATTASSPKPSAGSWFSSFRANHPKLSKASLWGLGLTTVGVGSQYVMPMISGNNDEMIIPIDESSMGSDGSEDTNSETNLSQDDVPVIDTIGDTETVTPTKKSEPVVIPTESPTRISSINRPSNYIDHFPSESKSQLVGFDPEGIPIHVIKNEDGIFDYLNYGQSIMNNILQSSQAKDNRGIKANIFYSLNKPQYTGFAKIGRKLNYLNYVQ